MSDRFYRTSSDVGVDLDALSADDHERGRTHMSTNVDPDATDPTVGEREATKRHRDAIADTGDAYTQFHGWILDCSWCDFESVGKTKAEALRGMQRHYDSVLPEGCEIR